MRKEGIKLIAGLAAAAVLCGLPAAAGAAGYRSLSARIIKCAENNELKKIAVLEFSARGGAGRNDTEYAAEKIGLYLAGSKKTALIERALLERVLKEARLSTAPDGMADKAETLKNMLSLDAVVTGTVFPDGEKLMVLARLIDLRTGRVLLAVEAQAARLPPELLNGNYAVMELPAGWLADPLAALSGFSDAAVAEGGGACRGRFSRLTKLNAELVAAKAQYWALKMKAPGFSRATLAGNPGSEIRDSGVKARFYRLLAAYSRGETYAPVEPEKMLAVFDLLKMEKQVSDDCGFN